VKPDDSSHIVLRETSIRTSFRRRHTSSEAHPVWSSRLRIAYTEQRSLDDESCVYDNDDDIECRSRANTNDLRTCHKYRLSYRPIYIYIYYIYTRCVPRREFHITRSFRISLSSPRAAHTYCTVLSGTVRRMWSPYVADRFATTGRRSSTCSYSCYCRRL